MITSQNVLASLADIRLGAVTKSVVDLEMIRDVEVEKGQVSLTVELPSPAHPLEAELVERVRGAVLGLEGASTVRVGSAWRVRESDFTKPAIPGVKTVIAVASGKGGVGKSTVASNLAAGLARLGANVGLADLDIYGPSAPIALDAARSPGATQNEQLVPVPTDSGVAVLSMGQLVPDGRAVIWRGPMLHKMVTQFQMAAWGELDYLVLDLPPGTGDVQLTVTQSTPLTGAIIVTTPQEIALIDARKGLQMFRDAQVPILGIVENMAWYECAGCGKRHALFGSGGGRALAEKEQVPLLAELPVDHATMAAADGGTPVVLDDVSTIAPAWRAFVARAAAAAAERSLVRNPFKVLQ